MTYVAGQVTVMVPSYNYRQYLRECVESAATQTGVDVDVAVVDNASSDGSLELARQLAEEYGNVRLVVHPNNEGIITSFNRCRDEVRGEYALLLCADDMLTPGALARAVDFMDSHPRAVMAYGPTVDFLDLGDVDQAIYEGRKSDPIVYQGLDWIERRCRAATNPIRTPEVVMRSSALEVAGRLDTSLPFTSDLNMWLRLATHGDVGYLPGHVQALFRRHAGNFGAAFLDESARVRDMEARWMAFARFFESSTSDSHVSEWDPAVRRALAKEARYEATRVYVRSPDQREERILALIELAERLDPDGASRGEVTGWRLRRMLGPRVARYFPPLMVRGAAMRVRRHRSESLRRRRGV